MKYAIIIIIRQRKIFKIQKRKVAFMNTVHVIIERSVERGSKIGRIAIHLIMVIEGKQSLERGLRGVRREFKIRPHT